MSIEKIDREFEKGKVILVGNNPDGVLVHVAHLLAEKDIQFLDTVTITASDELIYLVGHGSKAKKKIDGRDMKEIADKLVKAGYTEEQSLYVTACDAGSTLKKVDTMVEVLEAEIKRSLSESIIEAKVCKCFDCISEMAEIDSDKMDLDSDKVKKELNKIIEDYIVKPTVNISSDADGKTIFINNMDKTELWILESTYTLMVLLLWQLPFIYLNRFLYSRELKYTQKMLDKVNCFKMSLITLFRGEIMSYDMDRFCKGVFFGIILLGLGIGLLIYGIIGGIVNDFFHMGQASVILTVIYLVFIGVNACLIGSLFKLYSKDSGSWYNFKYMWISLFFGNLAAIVVYFVNMINHMEGLLVGIISIIVALAAILVFNAIDCSKQRE